MAFLDCINRALPKKKISGKKADEVRDRFTKYYDSEIAAGKLPSDAETAATAWSLRITDAEVTARVRNRIKDQELYISFDEGLKTFGHTKHSNHGTVATASGNMLEANRFLIYKDSKSWFAMHNEFGDGSIWEVMMSHVNERSHNLAMLETFGRNPERARDMLKAHARHLAGFADAKNTGPAAKQQLDAVEQDLVRFDAMFDIMTRKNAMGAENTTAHFFSGLRNVITANVLGSASLVAIPGDLMTSVLARGSSNLPWVQGFGRYLQAMNPRDKTVQSLARRAGFVDDASTTLAYAAQRFSAMNTHGPAWTKRVADTVLRASLLTPHTQAMRWTHGLEFMGFLHDLKGVAFKDLPLQKTFAKYGVSEADWNAFRAIQSWEPEPGVHFLRPADIMSGKLSEAKLRLHDKFMSMIVNESRIAVPDATMGATAIWRGSTPPGTFRGELLASAAMFKNFPVTIAYMYGREALVKETNKGMASYIAAFGIGMTLVGALGVQMSELAQGRDSIDMGTPGFWGRAALKGGAIGIYGDFLFANVNSFGRPLGHQAAGPVADILSDLKSLTLGNAYNLMDGKDTSFGADALQLGTKALPGKSLWYSRLALERLVVEQIQRQIDPKFDSKMRRRQSNQVKLSGNQFWWAPGSTGPDRWPGQ